MYTKKLRGASPLSDPFPLGQATVDSPQEKNKKKKSLTFYLLFTVAINAALNVSNALILVSVWLMHFTIWHLQELASHRRVPCPFPPFS